MKKINKLLLTILLLLSSCEYNYFLEDRPDIRFVGETIVLSELDLIFEEDVKLKLKQVLIHYNVNGSLGRSELFNENRELSIIEHFTVANSDRLILNYVVKDELWEFKKPIVGYYIGRYNVGPRNEEVLRRYKTKYHPMVRKNGLLNGDNAAYNLTYLPDGSIYSEFKPKITFYTGNDEYTNLYFETVNWNGNKELRFKTNKLNKVSFNLNLPLKSDDVQRRIDNGDYQTYITNGRTYYLIDNNLYMTRYNSYVYVGSIYGFSGITSMTTMCYEFIFEIL